MKKATKIVVEYDDGSYAFADGEAATKIWEWLMACQSLNLVHGAVYKGPQFITKGKEQ